MVPSGMGGILVIMVVVFVVSSILTTKYMKTQQKKAKENPGSVPPWQKNLPQIITGIVLAIIVIIWIAGSPGGSSRSSGVSGRPWEELGVSEREYMQVYNKYKYGE